MDYLDLQYFPGNKFLLSFVGLWPLHISIMKIAKVLFGLFCTTIGILLQVMHISKHLNDVDEIFNVLPPTCGFIISLVKTIILPFQVKKFKALLRLTQDDWNYLAENMEIEIMMRYTKSSQNPLLGPVFDIISPLNETRSRRLVFSIDSVVYEEEYFYILMLSEFIVITVSTVIVSADCVYFSLLQHSCGMQAVLCHRLANLKKRDNSRVVSNDKSYGQDTFDYRVRRCIQLDTRIRMYTKLLVSVFAIILFMDIALAALAQSFSCVQIVIRLGQSLEITQNIAAVLILTLRFLVISCIGQNIIDHSSAIPIAAYDAMWYIMPVKVQKMLKLLIARSQNHFRIIIGGVYVIDLENFSWVMKTSVSYCMVMLSLRSTIDNI